METWETLNKISFPKLYLSFILANVSFHTGKYGLILEKPYQKQRRVT